MLSRNKVFEKFIFLKRRQCILVCKRFLYEVVFFIKAVKSSFHILFCFKFFKFKLKHSVLKVSKPLLASFSLAWVHTQFFFFFLLSFHYSEGLNGSNKPVVVDIYLILGMVLCSPVLTLFSVTRPPWCFKLPSVLPVWGWTWPTSVHIPSSACPCQFMPCLHLSQV